MIPELLVEKMWPGSSWKSNSSFADFLSFSRLASPRNSPDDRRCDQEERRQAAQPQLR